MVERIFNMGRQKRHEIFQPTGTELTVANREQVYAALGDTFRGIAAAARQVEVGMLHGASPQEKQKIAKDVKSREGLYPAVLLRSVSGAMAADTMITKQGHQQLGNVSKQSADFVGRQITHVQEVLQREPVGSNIPDHDRQLLEPYVGMIIPDNIPDSLEARMATYMNHRDAERAGWSTDQLHAESILVYAGMIAKQDKEFASLSPDEQKVLLALNQFSSFMMEVLAQKNGSGKPFYIELVDAVYGQFNSKNHPHNQMYDGTRFGGVTALHPVSMDKIYPRTFRNMTRATLGSLPVGSSLARAVSAGYFAPDYEWSMMWRSIGRAAFSSVVLPGCLFDDQTVSISLLEALDAYYKNGKVTHPDVQKNIQAVRKHIIEGTAQAAKAYFDWWCMTPGMTSTMLADKYMDQGVVPINQPGLNTQRATTLIARIGTDILSMANGSAQNPAATTPDWYINGTDLAPKPAATVTTGLPSGSKK